METIKKYKKEIFILIILICILIIFYLIGWFNIKSVISDGTFIIGFLSIPLAASRFISEKEESNRINKKQNELEADKFYYETLNILDDLSGYSTIQIKIMQLIKIGIQGNKYISVDSLDNFNEILTNTAVNILTQDINFTEDKYDKIILGFSDRSGIVTEKTSTKEILETNNEVLDLLTERINSNYTHLRKIFKFDKVYEEDISNIELIDSKISEILAYKYSNKLYWKAHFSEEDYDGIDFDRGSDCIFYECQFDNFSDFEKISNYTLIRPLFNFDNESKKDNFISTWDPVDDKVTFPHAIYKGNRISLIDEINNNDNVIKVDYWVEREDLTRKQIRERFGDRYCVKISRNYNNEHNGTYNSWYTISKELKQNIENENKDVVFVIDNNDNVNLYIKAGNKNISKLFELKEKEHNGELQRYHFYINAYKMEGDTYDLEDSRFSESAIKFKSNKTNFL